MKVITVWSMSLILAAGAFAQEPAQRPKPTKTELQTCREDLATEQHVAEELFAMAKNSTPEPKAESQIELQKKYDDLIRRFNENVEKHNQLVDRYVALDKQYDQLYDLAIQMVSTPAVPTPRSRVSAFMRGFSRSIAEQRQVKAESITCNTVNFGATSSTNCY